MEKVLGVMAEMNPEISLLKEAVQSFRGQMEGIIIVDNSTKPEIKKEVRQIETESDGFVTVIWNEQDIGNSGSFTQGSRLAVEHGAKWVITVNDDTILQPGTVAMMLEAYNALSPEIQKSIGLISPNLSSVRGLSYSETEPVVNDNAGTAEGQLVKTAVFPIAGYWNDALFIDTIDWEFCFRVKLAGFKNLLVPSAVVGTRWGHPIMRNFFGKSVYVPNYGAYRYYYMSRNLVYLYIRNFRIYILKNDHWYHAIWAVVIPRFFIKMVLFENNRKVKIRACWNGAWDGIRGRLGPMPK